MLVFSINIKLSKNMISVLINFIFYRLYDSWSQVVSEGFGEEVFQPQKIAKLSQLKDKAKLLVNEQCVQPPNVLNILEEVCKEGDRLQEESRREKNDLLLQVR